MYLGVRMGITPVAVKMMRLDSGQRASRLKNEVEVMKACRDPNIVQARPPPAPRPPACPAPPSCTTGPVSPRGQGWSAKGFGVGPGVRATHDVCHPWLRRS